MVTYGEGPLGEDPALDVVICGGTLGLFLATSLQMRGFKVSLPMPGCCVQVPCSGFKCMGAARPLHGLGVQGLMSRLAQTSNAACSMRRTCVCMYACVDKLNRPLGMYDYSNRCSFPQLARCPRRPFHAHRNFFSILLAATWTSPAPFHTLNRRNRAHLKA